MSQSARAPAPSGKLYIQSTGFLSDLKTYPIAVMSSGMGRACDEALELARNHGLTVYDAVYLQLSISAALPLATLDDELLAAATVIGVPIYTPLSG